MDDQHKRHLAQIVTVLSDIVGGQTQVLLRIERGLVEQNRAYKDLLNKINLFDKKVHGGFTVLEDNRLATLEKNVTEGLTNLDYSYLKKLKQELDSVHAKLQQQVNVQLLQLLIKKSQRAAVIPRGRAPSVVRPSGIRPSRRKPTTPTYAMASAISELKPAAAPQQETAEAPDGEWSESELEGGQIFDTLITGWKRRDWEKIVQGTKEMFMRAWKKLSKTDKQKIRNGAWSKPIIKKLKMMSRES
ncbi:MAG: hypothetical protein HWN66_10020 [Candidatus Helarchaeota archaeon]|nr:hypothetical protein [Candidatus Helarchaeota archaeon]